MVLEEPDWDERFPGENSATFRRDLHAFWTTVAPVLERWTPVEPIDGTTFEHLLAVPWAFAVDAERRLAADDLTPDERAVYREVANEQRESVRVGMHEFGITPLSRKNLGVSRSGYGQLDELERRIEERGGISFAS